MNTGVAANDTAPRRIGIFADGLVGARILAGIVAYAPECLIALIVNSDSILENVSLPSQCDVMRWDPQKEQTVVEWLNSKELDLALLAWWPYLLRGSILNSAPMILNTHPSFLPYCRGKDPNFWAIVDSVPYGVSIHHVNSAIDAGDIAFQKEIPVLWTDTGATLYQKGLESMVDLFNEALPTIVRGVIPRIPQPGEGTLHYRKQLAPASSIELDAPTTARNLLNRLRAGTFPPYPACRFTDQGTEYDVRVSISMVPSEGN